MATDVIKIQVDQTYKETTEKVKDYYSQIKSKNGFNEKDEQRVSGYIKKLEAMIQSGNVIGRDFKEVSDKAFKVLLDASVKISDMSEVVKKLQTQQIQKLSRLTDLSSQKASLISRAGQAKYDKTSGQFVPGTEFFRKNQVFLPNKEGKPSARALTNPDKIRSYIEEGKNLYIKPEGKDPVPFNQSNFQDFTKDIEAWNNKLKEIETQTAQVKEELQQINADIAKQTAIDKQKTGLTPSNLTQKIAASSQMLNRTYEQEVINENIEKNTGEITDIGDISSFTGDLNKQSTSIGKVFKQFSFYSIALNGVKKAAREAVSTIKELDAALTEQAMITGKSRSEVSNMITQYQQLAIQTGSTTKEIASVSTEFLRQGKTIQESLTLTEAAISAARVAGISGSDSINYLTTALNGFQLSSTQAMKVSDKFAAVAAASATDYEELATALSKVASQANVAGMSIDYTTALLAKGIETTREAPETIGTALKTIIARMREITDYGETLEDGVDLNNVETQLKYIGIQLTTNEGELRSTEDVLDELGKKWDTLNSNQRAAVAKALAGTRQQARLIAMMSNYERVTELQEIAQRSQGSTLSQMNEYMNGLEAALNKVKVAWESVVKNIANNEFIIWVTNVVAAGVSVFGDLMKNFPFIVALAGKALGIAAKRIEIAKAQAILERQAQKQRLLELQQQQKNRLDAQEELIKKQEEEEKIAKSKIEALIKENTLLEKNTELRDQQTKLSETELKLQKARRKILEAEKVLNNATKKERKEATKSWKTATEEQKKASEEFENVRDSFNKKLDNIVSKNEDKTGIKDIDKNKFYILKEGKYIESRWQDKGSRKGSNILKENPQIELAQQVEEIKQTSDAVQTKTNETADKLKDSQEIFEAYVTIYDNMSMALDKLNFSQSGALSGFASMAKVILSGAKNLGGATKTLFKNAKEGVFGLKKSLGWIDWILTTVVTSITVIAAISKYIKNNLTTQSKIDKLAQENTQLNKQYTNLKSISSQYEAIDNKILKTNENLKEMNNLLEQAAESMSEDYTADGRKISWIEKTLDSWGLIDVETEKEAYEKSGNKKEFLKNAEKVKSQQQFNNNLQILDKISKNQDTINNNADNIKSIGNSFLYSYIDKIKESNKVTDEEASSLETFTSNLIENMNAQQAYELVNDKTGDKVEKFAEAIRKAAIRINGLQQSIGDVLTGEEFNFAEKIEAYKSGLAQNNEALTNSLKSLYGNSLGVLAQMDDSVIETFDNLNLTMDKVNTLYKGYSTIMKSVSLNEREKAATLMTNEQYQQNISNLMAALAKGESLNDAINETFGEFLNGLEDQTDAFNAILNQLTNTYVQSLLNIGQNVDSSSNKVAGVFNKAANWNTLTDTEKAEYLSSSDIFTGQGSAELYKAFESQDYNYIQNALANSETLFKEYQKRKKEIDDALAVEEARLGEERNEAVIAYYKELQKQYSSYQDFITPSVETLKEQQDKQIQAYKEYLNAEKDALEDSLNKRKDAYQKYFDAINESENDQDFEEERQTLVANISKLQGSNAQSSAKRAELEQQLKEKDKERQKELRERGQEQVINNIEDEIDNISNKFDDLINSEQAILDEIKSLSGEELISRLVQGQVWSGNDTQVGLSSFIKNIPSYGSLTSGIDQDKIKIEQQGNSLVLNIEGRTYTMSQADQNFVFTTVMNALTQIGKV